MRVLVVEDDVKIASFVKKGLEQAGFSVDHADNGEDGFHLLSTEPYDAAVVDIILPRMDGVTMVESLRSQGCMTPVIFLSARRSVEERVKGLQAGGDDYLVKPFAFSELLARVRSLIRRATGAKEATRLVAGVLEMDLARHVVLKGGSELELQPREFQLLEYLMRHVGTVVSKTMIMEHVWDYNFDPQTNVVEANICRLRKKIDGEGSSGVIRTVRGVGYVLEGEEA